MIGLWGAVILAVRGETLEHVITVAGPVAPDAMGFTLTHEHIMSNFGRDPQRIGSYDEAALWVQVVPYLQTLHTQGVNSVVDCTTAYFGRNVELLRGLATDSGLQLITNTGWYGAA